MIIFLCGCTGNGYKKFYRPYYVLEHTPKTDRDPIVYNVSDKDHDSYIKRIQANGFSCVGESAFSSGTYPSEKSAINFGKKLGASYIILSRSFEGTQSGTYSLTTPTQSTTYHSGNTYNSGNVNLYSNGNYGTANYTGSGYYSGSSTTYGSKTTNIPYTITRYIYRASYFVETVKLSPPLESRFPNQSRKSKHADTLEISEKLNKELDQLLKEQTK